MPWHICWKLKSAQYLALYEICSKLVFIFWLGHLGNSFSHFSCSLTDPYTLFPSAWTLKSWFTKKNCELNLSWLGILLSLASSQQLFEVSSYVQSACFFILMYLILKLDQIILCIGLNHTAFQGTNIVSDLCKPSWNPLLNKYRGNSNMIKVLLVMVLDVFFYVVLFFCFLLLEAYSNSMMPNIQLSGKTHQLPIWKHNLVYKSRTITFFELSYSVIWTSK